MHNCIYKYMPPLQGALSEWLSDDNHIHSSTSQCMNIAETESTYPVDAF